MDKEEAMKILKDFHDKSALFSVRTALDTIIPELRESEDERIRKSIIEHFTKLQEQTKEQGYNCDFSNTIAWLEKQGEQKHTPKHKVGDTIYYNSFGEVKSMIVTNVVTDSTDNPMYEDENGSAVFEEDLIEQKSADKVEPKFHEGDIIQFNGFGHNRYTIKNVCGLSHYINTIGEKMDMSYTDANFELIEDSDKIKLCHAWSEEDERIYVSILNDLRQNVIPDEEDIGWLKSLKGRVQPKHEWSEEDNNNMQFIDAVLFYDKDLPEDTCMRLRNWLKSLKPNKDMVEALRTEYEKGRADTIAEMKSSWSEEDEKILNNLIDYIKVDDALQYSEKQVVDWLKSLKDRVQPQPKHEWSIEDEKVIAIINNTLTESNTPPDDYDKVYDWLESLRKRIGG